jgi:hypothetical protein
MILGRDPSYPQQPRGVFTCRRCDEYLPHDTILCNWCQADDDKRRGDDTDRADWEDE